MIIGHERWMEQLTRELPPVTLLKGPPSIGKRTMARHLLKAHGALPADTQEIGQLSTAKAHELRENMGRAPFGPIRGTIIALDNAPERALHALLKTLEEPPARTATLLTTSQQTMLTVESRSATFALGALSEAEIAQILMTRKGKDPATALRLAAAGGGRVRPAMEAADLMTRKSPVLSLLRAAATGDTDLFHAAIKSWGPQEHELLQRWALEAATGRYATFTAQETFGLARDPATPRRIRARLVTGARPKLAAKLALLDLLQENRQ
jgi:hypothetical protein